MKVRYTRQAARELEEILDHLAGQSPSGARNVLARVVALERLLTSFPELGRATSLGWLRRLPVRPYPYVLQYEIRDGVVVILNVRHAARRDFEPPRS